MAMMRTPALLVAVKNEDPMGRGMPRKKETLRLDHIVGLFHDFHVLYQPQSMEQCLRVSKICLDLLMNRLTPQTDAVLAGNQQKHGAVVLPTLREHWVTYRFPTKEALMSFTLDMAREVMLRVQGLPNPPYEFYYVNVKEECILILDEGKSLHAEQILPIAKKIVDNIRNGLEGDVEQALNDWTSLFGRFLASEISLTNLYWFFTLL